MIDQQRRRFRPAPAPRPVGSPNVLSDQATPNTLSTMANAGGIAAPVVPSTLRASTRTIPSNTMATRPTALTGQATSASDARFERRRPRISLGTVIFIGFLIYWALRYLGS